MDQNDALFNRIKDFIRNASVGEQMMEGYKVELPDGVEGSVVSQYGGEGEGRDYYTVWKFTEASAEVFVKFYGYYQSHYGTEYEGFDRVYPKEVTVTKYSTEA